MPQTRNNWPVNDQRNVIVFQEGKYTLFVARRCCRTSWPPHIQTQSS
jgi:hypothetical protein